MLVTAVIMAQFQNLAAGVAAGDVARQTPRAMLNVSLTGGIRGHLNLRNMVKKP